jgi:AraC-like DNA-binding protein
MTACETPQRVDLAAWWQAGARICDDYGVTEDNATNVYADHDWITLKEAATQLGVSSGRLHRLIEERYLCSVKYDGDKKMPQAFVIDGEPLAGLRGTLTLLADHGIEGDEAMTWLLTEDDGLGATPVRALQQGRKAPVRKLVQLFAG